MINAIALHKLAKFGHSRMILIFVLATVFIGLLSFLPAIFAKSMASGVSIGGNVAAGYFDIVEMFGTLVAIALGVLLWRQDDKDGTLPIFLARPISRSGLLLGKLLGALYVLLIYLAVSLAIYFVAHLALFDYSIPAIFLAYLLQAIVKWVAILSLGLFLSSLLGSLLASVVVLAYIVLGMLGNALLSFPPQWTQVSGKVIKFIVMSLDKGCELELLLLSDMSSSTPLFNGIAYYALWSVMLISASLILFSRRQFSGKRS